MKVNMHTPTSSLVRKICNAAENLNKSKNIKIGKSGLPVELPNNKDNNKEDKVVDFLLNEVYNF